MLLFQAKSYYCPRGEMDITMVFGTVIGGSNPPEDAKKFKCAHSSMVEQLPLKQLVSGSNPDGRTRKK